jgi:hypothetical protein
MRRETSAGLTFNALMARGGAREDSSAVVTVVEAMRRTSESSD